MVFFFFVKIKEARPKVTLVARMSASVANYDYIVDWEFQADGLIRIKVTLLFSLVISNQGFPAMHLHHLSLS